MVQAMCLEMLFNRTRRLPLTFMPRVCTASPEADSARAFVSLGPSIWAVNPAPWSLLDSQMPLRIQEY